MSKVCFSLLRVFPALVILLIFTFSSTSIKAFNIPQCTPDTQGTTIGETATSPDDCPSGTFCYDDAGPSVTVRYGCHQQKPTAPVPAAPAAPQPVTPSTTPITITPNPAQQGHAMNIKVNYVVGLGTYRMSVALPGQTEPNGLIFTVNGSGCTRVSGNVRYTSITCNVDASNNAWSADINYDLTYGTDKYEVSLAGQSSTGSGVAFNTSFCVNSCPAEKLTVSINPPGPLKNNEANNLIVSWSPAIPGKTYQVTLTGDIFKPMGVTCSNSNCSTRVNVPANETPGTKTIVIKRDDDSSDSGSVDFELQGAAGVKSDVKGCVKPGEPGYDPESADACSSAAGKACTDGVEGIDTAIGCIPTDPVKFVQGFIRLAIGIGGGVALLLMILGAFEMITSAGNPDRLKEGQGRFTNAIIGLLFIIFSVLLMKIIGVDILGLGGYLGVATP